MKNAIVWHGIYSQSSPISDLWVWLEKYGSNSSQCKKSLCSLWNHNKWSNRWIDGKLCFSFTKKNTKLCNIYRTLSGICSFPSGVRPYCSTAFFIYCNLLNYSGTALVWDLFKVTSSSKKNLVSCKWSFCIQYSPSYS